MTLPADVDTVSDAVRRVVRDVRTTTPLRFDARLERADETQSPIQRPVPDESCVVTFVLGDEPLTPAVIVLPGGSAATARVQLAGKAG